MLKAMNPRPEIKETVNTVLGVISIETATLHDFAWITRTQAKYSNQVGFLTYSAIKERLRMNDYWQIKLENDDCGYVCVGGGRRQEHRLAQIAVEEDLWGNGLGSTVLRSMLAYTVKTVMPNIVATVRDGLAMNGVANDTGGILTAQTVVRTARKLPCNHYRWYNNPHDDRNPLGDLFGIDPKGLTAHLTAEHTRNSSSACVVDRFTPQQVG